MCDDAANIEECLFDGGDCCLETKNRHLCQDCHCRKPVDALFVENGIDAKQLGIIGLRVSSVESLEQNIAGIFRDMVKSDECSMMCLLLDSKSIVAAWFFNPLEKLCVCLSRFVPHHFLCPEAHATTTRSTLIDMYIPATNSCVWFCGKYCIVSKSYSFIEILFQDLEISLVTTLSPNGGVEATILDVPFKKVATL